MSPQERQHEKIVLQERRKLVQSGINKTDIQIRGDSLFVNGNKYGFATNTGFTQLPPIDPTDDDPQEVPTSQDNCSEHQTPQPPNSNLNNWLSVALLNSRSLINKFDLLQSLVFSKAWM